jgi:electron transfer flavoprotein alpha subunit
MREQPGEVWVVVEQTGGGPAEVSLELLGKARELAAHGGGSQTSAVIMGSGVGHLAEELIAGGADRVYIVDDHRLELYVNNTYALVLEHLIKKHRPEMCSASPRSRQRAFGNGGGQAGDRPGGTLRRPFY